MSNFSMESINPGDLNLGLTSPSETMPKTDLTKGGKWGHWLYWGLIAVVVIYSLYCVGMWAYKRYQMDDGKKMRQHHPPTDMNMPTPVYDDTEESAMMQSVPGSRYAAFEENPY
jgi:hypothetical protein